MFLHVDRASYGIESALMF